MTFEPASCDFLSVMVGDSVTVKCCVTPMSRGSHVSLSRRAVYPAQPDVVTLDFISLSACATLCVSTVFDSITPADGGQYFCQVNGSFIEEQSTFIFVNGITPPPTPYDCSDVAPVITFEPTPCDFLTVTEGDSVTIQCCMTPMRSGSQLTLSRRKVFPGQSSVATSDTAALSSCATFCVSITFDRITTADRGEYTCQMDSNLFVQEQTTFIFVNV